MRPDASSSNLAGDVEKLFKSLLPDPAANRVRADPQGVSVIAEKIRSDVPAPPTSPSVMEEVEDLLDKSIATEGLCDPPVGDRQPTTST